MFKNVGLFYMIGFYKRTYYKKAYEGAFLMSNNYCDLQYNTKKHFDQIS